MYGFPASRPELVLSFKANSVQIYHENGCYRFYNN